MPRTKKPPQPSKSEQDAARAILADNAILFGFRIGYLANLFSGPIYKELDRSYGLGRPEWVIVFCLAHFDGLNAHEVGRMTGRAKASVSRAVHKLLKLRMISRASDPADARRAILRLTAAGRRFYEETLPLFVEREKGMLAVLSPRERAEFGRLLDRLVRRDDGWDSPY